MEANTFASWPLRSVGSMMYWTSPAKGQVWGAGLPYGVSLAVGVLVSVAFAAFAVWRGRRGEDAK